jgi:hypothetical protein
MTASADRSMLIAQTLGEYGALSRIGTGIGHLVDEARIALRDPTTATIAILIVIVLAYFLLRRR